MIELWLENSFLVEVLTEEMQAEYLAFMAPDTWRRTVRRISAGAGKPAADVRIAARGEQRGGLTIRGSRALLPRTTSKRMACGPGDRTL